MQKTAKIVNLEGISISTPLAEQRPQVELRWDRGPEIRWRHPQEHVWGHRMLGIVKIGPLEGILWPQMQNDAGMTHGEGKG